MVYMKAVAPHDRPREKLARLGAASLGDNELVAIIIGQGQARASALDLANALLTSIGGIDRSDAHVTGICYSYGASVAREPRRYSRRRSSGAASSHAVVASACK